MDCTSEQLFSGSRFAEQQNSRFRLSNALRFTYRAFDYFRLADDSWKTVATRPVFLQEDIFSSQPGLFKCAVNQQQEMIRVDWFLQKVMRAILHRLNCFINRAESSHHNHGNVWVGGACSSQHIQTRTIWHSQVCKYKTMSGGRNFVCC